MHGNIPSPQGDFLVVMFRTLVGILTGPLTLSLLSFAPRTKSAHTVIDNQRQSNRNSIANRKKKKKDQYYKLRSMYTFTN